MVQLHPTDSYRLIRGRGPLGRPTGGAVLGKNRFDGFPEGGIAEANALCVLNPSLAVYHWCNIMDDEKYYVFYVRGSCLTGDRNAGMAEFRTWQDARREFDEILTNHPEAQVVLIKGVEIDRV